jgi:hypothetical protein
LSCYLERVTKDGFKYRALADVKAGDHKKLVHGIPKPWVEDKAFTLSGYTKHKHPANPTGLDEDEMLAHKVPADAQKKSDALAKQQLQVRAQLVKLQLPAAEIARSLYDMTNPQDSPTALKAWITDTFYEGPEDDQPDACPDAERYCRRSCSADPRLRSADAESTGGRASDRCSGSGSVRQGAHNHVLAALECVGGADESGHRPLPHCCEPRRRPLEAQKSAERAQEARQ